MADNYYKWLAGLIDGRGTFYCNKGFCMLTIKVNIRDLSCLEYIKNRIGFGSISIFHGSYEYCLKHQPSLLILLNGLNGHIVTKLVSYSAMCKHLGINFDIPTPHVASSPYFAGLFDSNGFIGYYLSE